MAVVGTLVAFALQLLSRSTYSRMRQNRAAVSRASDSETAPLLAGSGGSRST